MSASRRETAATLRERILSPARTRLDPLAYAEAYRQRTVDIVNRLALAPVAELIEILRVALDERRHVFVCGNGGSAATASHFAAGLGKEGSRGRPTKFRVMSLTDNVPWITSLANDADYSAVFVEQLENFAEVDDILIAFTGSGNSPNVVRAIEWGNANGLATVGVTGRPGGRVGRLAQHVISVDSPHMGHLEEAHFLIQHLVSYYFEDSE